MARPVFAPTAARASDPQPATAAFAGTGEAERRFAVRLVLFIYVLSLIEGPLRKWFLPGLSTPIYFLRDPFVLLLYIHAFRHGLFAWGTLGRIWVVFAATASLVALVPFAIQGLDLRAWVLGVRSYWVWLPLAFVVAGTFRTADLVGFLRWNVLLSVPYAMLVATQYRAGPDAWINRGVAGDTEIAVGLTEEIVRPFGLFSYTGPNVDFTAAMVAFFVAYYLLAERERWRTVILLAGGIGVGSMAVLTGSRSIYFLVAAILLMTLVGSSIANPTGRTIGRNLGILVFVILAGVLFVFAFPDMLAAMERRVEIAAQSRLTIEGRITTALIGFVGPFATAPLFGYGMATGTPAISRFLGLQALRYGESELGRVVNELGPLLGLGFVALRYGTAVILGLRALATARRGNLGALPLAGYAGVPIAIGQLTHSSLNGFLPWLVAGFVLALAANTAGTKTSVRRTLFTPDAAEPEHPSKSR